MFSNSMLSAKYNEVKAIELYSNGSDKVSEWLELMIPLIFITYRKNFCDISLNDVDDLFGAAIVKLMEKWNSKIVLDPKVYSFYFRKVIRYAMIDELKRVQPSTIDADIGFSRLEHPYMMIIKMYIESLPHVVKRKVLKRIRLKDSASEKACCAVVNAIINNKPIPYAVVRSYKCDPTFIVDYVRVLIREALYEEGFTNGSYADIIPKPQDLFLYEPNEEFGRI